MALTITRGFPGSGKSTWADKEVLASKGKIVGVNRDALRMMTGRKWWPANEALISVIQREAILGALGQGLSVIVDDTFLKEQHVGQMRELAQRYDTEFVIKSFLHVPLHVCIERDRHRDRSVGKDVIVRMYYDYWAQAEKPRNEGKRAILVDVDGTLAHTDVPYPAAYSRDYSQDLYDRNIGEIVNYHHRDGYAVIVMSGRHGGHRAVTEQWLWKHGVAFDLLLMRPEEDQKTDDATIKKQLYLDHVQGRYGVVLAIDDRPRVVRMWRAELGLSVLDVGDGIEF